MNKLHFSKDNGSLFYKALTDAVNDYFTGNNLPRYGNKKMLFKIGLYFSLVILFYSLMLCSHSVTAFFICYLLLGLAVLLTAFNIAHDAAHGVAVKSKRWNRILFQLSFQLQGNNAYVWGKHHNESHHLYTNVEGSDIDVLHNPLVRMTDEQPLKWYHQYQHLYCPFLYLLYSLNWFFFRETLMLFNISSRTIHIRIPKQEVIKLIFFKAFYVGYMIVLPAYLLPFGTGTILLAFLCNHFLVSLIFVSVLGVSHLSDYVHHPQANANNELPMSWPTLQMITSVDYNSGSSFFNWTLGGFNAHALHHLLPQICHVHYINILPIFRRLCKEHGIVYMELPYQEAFRSHFRFLRKMGHQQHLQITFYER